MCTHEIYININQYPFTCYIPIISIYLSIYLSISLYIYRVHIIIYRHIHRYVPLYIHPHLPLHHRRLQRHSRTAPPGWTSWRCPWRPSRPCPRMAWGAPGVAQPGKMGRGCQINVLLHIYIWVSIKGGTPKWMVYSAAVDMSHNRFSTKPAVCRNLWLMDHHIYVHIYIYMSG